MPEPTEKKLKKLKPHPKSALLEGLDKVQLTKRMTYGQYHGMSDEQVKTAVTGKKKVKRDADVSSLLAIRRQKRKKKKIEQRLIAEEKERVKKEAIAVVDVAPEDREAFVVALDEQAQNLRNFMLKRLASTQFGVTSALDTVLQELNIIMDGGVSVNAISPFMRLNNEVALVAITKRICELYGLDRRTTRKIIDAKIEFMRPTEFKPVGNDLAGITGRAGIGSAKGRSPAK